MEGPVARTESSGNPLTLEALANFTKHHPPSARRTVQSFLDGQRGLKFPVEPLSTHAPTPSPQILVISHPRSPPDRIRPETALVLGHSSDGGRRQRKKESKESLKDKEERPSKRPSLVASMRPRLSSAHAPSPSINSQPAQSHGNQNGVHSTPILEGKELLKQHLSRESSPYLVPRTSRSSVRRAALPGTKEEQEMAESTKENTIPASSPKKKSKGKGKEIVQEGLVETKKSKRKVEADPDVEPEHIQRLDARRERRREKALIVKDRTTKPAATGAAAATKVKKATKKQRAEENGTSSGGSSSSQPKQKKKKRSKAEQTNEILQREKRSKNVLGARLTLRPAAKYGLFNKGAASVKTRVGLKLPDLAFSELSFLNAPAPRPRPPSTQSSSSSADPPPRKSATKKSAKPTEKKKAVPTASKAANTASKYFGEAPLATSASSDDPLPSPPPVRKAKNPAAAPQKKSVAAKKQAEKAKTLSPSPSPSLSSAPASDNLPSATSLHSAHSLRRRKFATATNSPRPGEVIDTTNAFGFSFLPAEARQAVSNPVEEQSGPTSPQGRVESPSSFDLLLRMCETGEPDSRIMGSLIAASHSEGMMESEFQSPRMEVEDVEEQRDEAAHDFSFDPALGISMAPDEFGEVLEMPIEGEEELKDHEEPYLGLPFDVLYETFQESLQQEMVANDVEEEVGSWEGGEGGGGFETFTDDGEYEQGRLAFQRGSTTSFLHHQRMHFKPTEAEEVAEDGGVDEFRESMRRHWVRSKP